MHRHDLGRVGVALQPKPEILRIGPRPALRQPRQQTRRAELTLDRDPGQHLAEVHEVRDPPIAALALEQTGQHRVVVEQPLEHRREALVPPEGAPAMERSDLVVEGIRLLLDLHEPVRRPPHQGSGERAPDQARGGGLRDRSEHGGQVRRLRRLEDRGVRLHHRRDAQRAERPLHRRRLLVRPHEHRAVPRRNRPRTSLGQGDAAPSGELICDIGSHQPGHPLGHEAAGDVVAPSIQLGTFAGEVPNQQRRTGIGEQPGGCVLGFDGRVERRLGPEGLVALEQDPQRLQQRGIRAEVPAQPLGGTRERLPGALVREHVGPAERVDRLLGIADQAHAV